jgi:hypothetical protein
LVVLLGGAAFAVILATTGTFTAMAGRVPRAAQPQQSVAPVSHGAATTATGQTRGHHGAVAAPTPSLASDPTALADGTYPTYVRDVDVRKGTITFDLIQVFTGESAVQEAMADGTPSDEAQQYLDYPYVRNQNDLLRVLPVTDNANIRFIDECEAPGSRDAALQELKDRTTPFEATYYYAVSVVKSSIDRVVQHIAVPAC